MEAESITLTAGQLRAQAAVARTPWYRIAARARVHPSRLSQVVNEHVPLTPEMALRIREAITAEAGG